MAIKVVRETPLVALAINLNSDSPLSITPTSPFSSLDGDAFLRAMIVRRFAMPVKALVKRTEAWLAPRERPFCLLAKC